VVGAGCSVESPTRLKLSRAYSADAHAALIRDGLLDEHECPEPEDLSALASTIHRKYGSQVEVVKRLPVNPFKLARANQGYLLAAALLLEKAVACVMTLNYDLALTDAARQLEADDIFEIAGPSDLPLFGDATIVYLHRSANESDFDKWILRKEALDEEWRCGWEQVVANRIMATPAVVFAGLGSPAAVLTETVGRIRRSVSDAMACYVVTRDKDNAFRDALKLEESNHIAAYWGEFMSALSQRVVTETVAELSSTCASPEIYHPSLCEKETLSAVCAGLSDLNLLELGRLRSRWLLDERCYTPDNLSQRKLLADLITGIAVFAEGAGVNVKYEENGLAHLQSEDEGRVMSILPITGSGHRRWTAFEPGLEAFIEGLPVKPDRLLASSFVGPRPGSISAPFDIIEGEPTDDVSSGFTYPDLDWLEDVYADPSRYRLEVD
jgi:hypothetical protein